MKLEWHEQRAVQAFGKPYTKVHKLLDQHFLIWGPSHRIILHHQRGIDLIAQKIEEPVRKVAEQHIIDDLGVCPNDWREFDFGPSFNYFDLVISKRVGMVPGSLIELMRQLYPDFICHKLS